MEDDVDAFDDEKSIEQTFKSASNYLRQIGSSYDTEKLLYFYARFKQSTEGPCRAPKPGFFDFQGKQKWEAWTKIGDMSKEQAMMEYISLLQNLEPDWKSKMCEGGEGDDHKTLKDGTKRGMGVAVSTMMCSDEQLSDQQKTIFHWCQEGNVDCVRAMLASGGHQINQLDSEGLGLLHWASDHGLDDMVCMLLDNGADINMQDSEGQTALHYAMSCGHENVVEILVSHKADVTLCDSDGNTPVDVACNEKIKSLITGSNSVLQV